MARFMRAMIVSIWSAPQHARGHGEVAIEDRPRLLHPALRSKHVPEVVQRTQRVHVLLAELALVHGHELAQQLRLLKVPGHRRADDVAAPEQQVRLVAARIAGFLSRTECDLLKLASRVDLAAAEKRLGQVVQRSDGLRVMPAHDVEPGLELHDAVVLGHPEDPEVTRRLRDVPHRAECGVVVGTENPLAGIEDLLVHLDLRVASGGRMGDRDVVASGAA